MTAYWCDHVELSHYARFNPVWERQRAYDSPEVAVVSFEHPTRSARDSRTDDEGSCVIRLLCPSLVRHAAMSFTTTYSMTCPKCGRPTCRVSFERHSSNRNLALAKFHCASCRLVKTESVLLKPRAGSIPTKQDAFNDAAMLRGTGQQDSKSSH
jgi:hypothetical protein